MSTSGTLVVAVLGTGVIGFPVARNLATGGFTVRAWNRSRGKAEGLAEKGVQIVDTPADVVRGADIVVIVLKDGPAVADTVKAAEEGLHDGVVWVQMSTVGEEVEGLAAFAADRGPVFVDAPVQGTRQPAENAQLVVPAAGPQDVRPRVQPLFDTIGERTPWVGEALAPAKGLDVDPQHFLDVVTGGPMDNGYFQVKSAVILSGDLTPSFTVDNAEKDARLVPAAAERVGVQMDSVRAGQARFARASALGHGGEDMTAGYFASFPAQPSPALGPAGAGGQTDSGLPARAFCHAYTDEAGRYQSLISDTSVFLSTEVEIQDPARSA